MPTMTDVQSVGANAKTGNVLAGKNFEFAPAPSIVNVYAVGSAVGLNIDVLVGGESIVSDEEISGANRFPQTDTDLLARTGASQGDRIFVAFRNTTAGAITANLLVEVLPL